MTLTQIRDVLTQLIEAGHGEEPLIDIDNRTKPFDYVIDEVTYNEKIKAVCIGWQAVERSDINE